jgi:hypothetical protein
MRELILLIKLFYFVVECYGFWTGMLLLEDVPFLGHDKLKLIQR